MEILFMARALTAFLLCSLFAGGPVEVSWADEPALNADQRRMIENHVRYAIGWSNFWTEYPRKGHNLPGTLDARVLQLQDSSWVVLLRQIGRYVQLFPAQDDAAPAVVRFSHIGDSGRGSNAAAEEDIRRLLMKKPCPMRPVEAGPRPGTIVLRSRWENCPDEYESPLLRQDIAIDIPDLTPPDYVNAETHPPTPEELIEKVREIVAHFYWPGTTEAVIPRFFVEDPEVFVVLRNPEFNGVLIMSRSHEEGWREEKLIEHGGKYDWSERIEKVLRLESARLLIPGTP